MPIIARYVTWEVFKIFSLALGGMTMMTTLGMGLREGLRHGFPPGVMLHVMPYMLPEILGITIPVAILFAVTHVFGRMSGANEVVALKSAGINPLYVIWPVLVMAGGLSVVAVVMYDKSATWGRHSVQRIGVESVEQIAYGVLRQERSFTSDNFSIAVHRVEGRRLIKPTITIGTGDDSPEMTLRAEEAEISADKERGLISFRCRHARIDLDGQVQFEDPGWIVRSVPLDHPAAPVHRDWLGMREIPSHVIKLSQDLAEIDAKLAADRFDSPAERQRQVENRDYIAWRIRRLQTEPYRRWANGFSCLCFALVGTPVAMLWRFENFLATFFVCFLPILSVFYPLLMIQEGLATSGAVPPVSFWLGDLLMAVAGVWLLRRVIRH